MNDPQPGLTPNMAVASLAAIRKQHETDTCAQAVSVQYIDLVVSFGAVNGSIKAAPQEVDLFEVL